MPDEQLLRGRSGQVYGRIKTVAKTEFLYDGSGRLVGRYQGENDMTYDQSGRLLGRGNLLMTLVKPT